MLKEFYDDAVASDASSLEIVFVSSDNSDTEFDSYWNEMSFAALPFDKRSEKNVRKKFVCSSVN